MNEDIIPVSNSTIIPLLLYHTTLAKKVLIPTLLVALERLLTTDDSTCSTGCQQYLYF